MEFTGFRAITEALKAVFLAYTPIIFDGHCCHRSPDALKALFLIAGDTKHPGTPTLTGEHIWQRREVGRRRTSVQWPSNTFYHFQRISAIVIGVFGNCIHLRPSGTFYFVTNTKQCLLLLFSDIATEKDPVTPLTSPFRNRL